MVARALGAVLARSLLYLAEIAVAVWGVVLIVDEAVFAPDCSQYRCPPGMERCVQIQIGCTARSMGARALYAAVGAGLILLAFFAARETWRARRRATNWPPAAAPA